MSKTYLVLSGLISRPDSINMKPFWMGLINIQSRLQTNDELIILGHTWNSEAKEFIRRIFNTELFSFQEFSLTPRIKESLDELNLRFPPPKQEAFYSQHEGKVYPNFVWMNQSRKIALSILNEMEFGLDDRIVLTRFDIGYRERTSHVSTIICDDSLPRDLIYLAYATHLDQGYADQWITFNAKFLKSFISLDELSLYNLFDENYYDTYLNNWPNSSKHSELKSLFRFIFRVLVVRFYTSIKLMFRINLLPLNIFKKISNGIELILYPIIDNVELDGKKNSATGSNPVRTLINNHALLKYGIYQMGLRKYVKFLNYRDFRNDSKYSLINPEPFIILIYSHSSYSDCWEMIISQFKLCIPNLSYKIYVSTEKSDISISLKKQFLDCEFLYYDERDLYSKRLSSILNQIDVDETIYFVHEDMPLFRPVNEVFLNTLIKFFTTSEEYYIKLVDTSAVKEKTQNDYFPNLVNNRGKYSLSIQPCLIKRKNIISLIGDRNLSIYDFERFAFSLNEKFSAVQGYRRVGKYGLVNDYFPHISTAIHHGKWSVSNWGKTLTTLLEKYKIDVSLRGMI